MGGRWINQMVLGHLALWKERTLYTNEALKDLSTILEYKKNVISIILRWAFLSITHNPGADIKITFMCGKYQSQSQIYKYEIERKYLQTNITKDNNP